LGKMLYNKSTSIRQEVFMPRFFVRNNQISEGIVTVTGDDAHHLSRSLRMAVGETVVVCDENAREYLCELTDFLPDRVLARVLTERVCEAEPPFFAHVFQALPKGDKLDSIIQKAIECGASALTTFESERCVVRMKDARLLWIAISTTFGFGYKELVIGVRILSAHNVHFCSKVSCRSMDYRTPKSFRLPPESWDCRHSII
jgi:hypothetical protein